ncbi:hypothetical protein EC968_005558 [Mortierella alpina]|nr:hypothetical protein EC968_005558 [Mortierella alpina]
MSIADSGLLQATLSQSRNAWTHSAFSRFIPEPAARGPGGKKYASELSLAGLCTVCIGPHMFLNTKFYTVINPPPPPPPPPASTSSTASNSTAAPTPTEEYAHSPCSTPPVVLGGSPAPERVIELILARTADMAAEAAAAGTVPNSITPTLLDIDLPSSLMRDSHLSAAQRDDETGGTMLKTEAAENFFSSTARPGGTASAIRTKVPPPRQYRPKHQIAFEFKENPGCRWLFPHESSLELTPEEGQEPARISASFYLPTMEENPAALSGYGSGSALVPGPGQATTMVILQATNELWAGLQHAINDPAATYRFMMDKMKNIPPRSYVQYKLPLDFPDEQLLPMGLKKLPDNKVVPISSLVPPKRKPETNDQQQGSKLKKTKAGQDDLQFSGSKSSRRTSSFAEVTGAPSRPRCSYCSIASTPRWRRGPDGPNSLCNRCGILWKRGKILQDASSAESTCESESSAAQPTVSASGAMPLTTTADAASRMRQESLGLTGDNRGYDEQYVRAVETGKRVTATSRLHSNAADGGLSNGDTLGLTLGGDKSSTSKRRGAKALESTGPKLVPIYQIGETAKVSSRSAGTSRKDKGDKGDKEKDKGKEKLKTKDKGREKDREQDREEIANVTPASSPSTGIDAGSSLGTTPASSGASTNDSAVRTPENSAAVAAASPTTLKPGSESKSATSNAASTRVTTTGAARAGKQKATSGVVGAAVTKTPHPASAGAKLSLLKAYASTPKYQISHPAAVATANLADDGLSFYATKNLYTNNTATFPLHFPTISIAFGPNNAYYMYPNCAMVLFENHFQIKLISGGERTEIDVRKEGIEETEFQVVDVGDGESMIVMKALLRQQLTRFDKELLNPERGECLIVFRFRERLDGGGPPVKPLLEQWLKTEVPVASQVASGEKS